MPKITQLKHESTELSGKLHNHQAEIWNHREVTNWPRITQLLSGSTERSGSLPKITQHSSGSTERSDNLPKITQLRCRKKRHILQGACDQIDQNWKHRELSNMPKITQLRGEAQRG